MKAPIDHTLHSEPHLQSTAPTQNTTVQHPPELNPQTFRREVQKALKQKGPRGDFTRILQKAAPAIRLTELPYEVASMILSNQAESFEEFIQAWSESILEQAKLDKKAHQRYQDQKKNLKKRIGFLKSTLLLSLNQGKLGAEPAQILLARLPEASPVDHDVLESGGRVDSESIFKNTAKTPALRAALSAPQSSSSFKL